MKLFTPDQAMKVTCLIFSISCCFGTTSAEYLYEESKSYAGLAAALAEYLGSACIYLLTDSSTKDNRFIEKVLKAVTHKHLRSANVYSFDEYHRLQESEIKTLKCYVPLQVIISHDNDTHRAFAEHSKKTSMYGSDSFWLVFVESLSPDYVSQYFRDISAPFDVQLFIAELKHNLQMTIKEVYRVTPETPLRTPFFGSWSLDSTLICPPPGLMYSRRKNLEGVEIKVGFVHSPPFTYHIEDKEKLSGYLGDIWQVIQGALNFTSSFTKKKNYGVYKEDGWSGLIEAVHKENFDVGIADFAVTPKRFSAVDYSLPLMQTTFQVIYKDFGLSVEADAMFLPLAYDLWATLVGWILLAAILLYFGCYLSDSTFSTRENLSFMASFFFVIGALCGQAGGCRVPQRFTCRTLFLSSFLITTIVIPSYSASLMSFLTILPPIVPFRNMKEFFLSGKCQMMVKYSTYEYDLFAYESPNDPYLHRIFKRDIEHLEKKDFPTSTRHAFEQICTNENLAFFGLNEAIEWAHIQIRREEGLNRKCSIRKMPFDAGKVSVGIIFPKKSHFRSIINYYFSAMHGSGLFHRLIRKHWPISKSIRMDELQPVQLINVFMMFVILGSGITIALVFFIIELHLGRKRMRAQCAAFRQTCQFQLLDDSDKKKLFRLVRRRGSGNDLFYGNYYNGEKMK